MPRRAKGPRLYLDPKRDQWAIRDGSHFVRTGCSGRDAAKAERFLAQYIDNKHSPTKTGSPLIAEVLTVFGLEVVPGKKSARNISYNISNLLKWWGDKTADDVTTKSCKAYASTKKDAAAAADIKVLRSALKHWHKEHTQLSRVPSIWMPAAAPPRSRWLTRDEAARLIKAAKPAPYLVRMILIGLYTGSRPGVVKALQWDWIDFNSGVMLRAAPGETIAENKRKPPVRLGKRILGHLRRWQKTAGDVPWVVHYNGAPIKDPHASWARAVKEAKLTGRVTPHTLRHTRATWLMRSGKVSIWGAAKALGMTTKTLEAVYGHHHPDFGNDGADV